MHIAAAVGTSVIALFGPTGAYNWGPWDNSMGQGSRVEGQEDPYQKRSGVQTFGIHTLIQKDWECVPCGADGCNKTKISKCLEDITPEEVIQTIVDKLRFEKQRGSIE